MRYDCFGIAKLQGDISNISWKKKMKCRKGWSVYQINKHGGDTVPGGVVLQDDTYPNLLPCNIATSFSIPNKFQRVWFWFAVHQMENLFRIERCTCTYQLCSKSDRM